MTGRRYCMCTVNRTWLMNEDMILFIFIFHKTVHTYFLVPGLLYCYCCNILCIIYSQAHDSPPVHSLITDTLVLCQIQIVQECFRKVFVDIVSIKHSLYIHVIFRYINHHQDMRISAPDIFWKIYIWWEITLSGNACVHEVSI